MALGLRGWVLVGAAAVVFAGGGVGLAVAAGREEPAAPDPVVVRINGEVACSTLQREFDNANVIVGAASGQADRDRALTWMETADRRMQTVGCYG